MDKTLTTGLTSLGREVTSHEYPSKESSKVTHTTYPQFCVRGNDDLLSAPEGEFYAVVKLKKGDFSRRKDWEDPNKTIAEVEFEILAIKQLEVETGGAKIAKVQKIDFSSLQDNSKVDEEYNEE